MGGAVGTLQPLLKSGGQNLSDLHPNDLTPAQKLDVLSEQILDWGMSQHDSHTGQFILTSDGHAAPIDKEQAYWQLSQGSPEQTGEQLSIGYSPNPSVPIYNAIWDQWTKNYFQFDPQDLKPYVDAFEAIPDSLLSEKLQPYAESKYPGDPDSQKQFIARALKRKHETRADFEKFFTGLYRKKLGKKTGDFTFENGFASKKAEEGRACRWKQQGAGRQGLPRDPSFPRGSVFQPGSR